ncbi:unnamed protein product, partial [Heterotrigona itama]
CFVPLTPPLFEGELYTDIGRVHWISFSLVPVCTRNDSSLSIEAVGRQKN